MLATTLLQNLQVLAIGSQSIAHDEYQDKQAGALAQRGQINTRMVTLLVDPKEAEILQLAMQAGSISLAMRNPLDAVQDARRLTRAREISPTASAGGVVTSADDADPFAEKKPEPVKAAAPAAPIRNEWLTTIIRGKESQTRAFPLPGSADEPPVSGAGAKQQPDAAAAPKASAAPAAAPVNVEPIGVGARG
jgi:Flp pilus assembly protein CpaB